MDETDHNRQLLKDAERLKQHISGGLYQFSDAYSSLQLPTEADMRPSAVLLLLHSQPPRDREFGEPCLVLTKRSSAVRQAGDLCCPGGGISPSKDQRLARLLWIPGSPLKRWPFWKKLRTRRDADTDGFRVLLAASLRESHEEIRLNPFHVSFLGMLPPQRLGRFQRAIYPMVGWTDRKTRFKLNWEVAKLVFIPLRSLLEPDNYACADFSVEQRSENPTQPDWNGYPCFIHKTGGHQEVLWGATFRIVMAFLETVFGFRPPSRHSLSTIHHVLDRNYYSGGRHGKA